MKRNLAPTIADILFVVVAPLTAITRTIKLTHSDGDLAAHIRMGQVILETGELPRRSLSSFTAANDPLVAHAWLSEIVFAALFAVGGLALISVVTGIVVAVTHAAVALFLRRRGVDPRWALAAAFIGLAVSSTHWLARPHMFSILGVTITILLLESRVRHRLLLFALLFLVWANLHGGWIYGLVMIAAYALGDFVEGRLAGVERKRWDTSLRSDVLALAVAAAATFANPYGWALHREVFGAATSSDLARQMAEFFPPDFRTLAPLPFLLALLLTVGLLAVAKGRMSAPRLTVVLLSAFFALRSFRNMALFGVSGWTLVALHVSTAWPRDRWTFPWFTEIARLDRTARAGLYAAPVAIALFALGVNSGKVGDARLIRDSFSPAHFPVAAVARAREAKLDGHVFEAWEWGGYIMNAWPEARLVVDPLEFNDATVRAFSEIDAVRPGWKSEMRRWNVRTVIIRSESRLAQTLEKDPEWKVWYRDSTSAVFRPATD